MSFSANHKSHKDYFNYLDKDYFEETIQKVISCKRDYSKKDQSRLRIPKVNSKFISSNVSNSSIRTNISIVKNKTNDFNYYSYPISPIQEENFENNFIEKRKFIYKSPSIINNKIISFQKQKNKKILEFPLFDENLIFKNINKSYLQDEYNDDGSESSDERIEDGRIFLSQELENSIKQLSKSLKKSQNEKLLSRRIRFKN
jgi:hypothetical protein